MNLDRMHPYSFQIDVKDEVIKIAARISDDRVVCVFAFRAPYAGVMGWGKPQALLAGNV